MILRLICAILGHRQPEPDPDARSHGQGLYAGACIRCGSHRCWPV